MNLMFDSFPSICNWHKIISVKTSVPLCFVPSCEKRDIFIFSVCLLWMSSRAMSCFLAWFLTFVSYVKTVEATKSFLEAFLLPFTDTKIHNLL